MGLVKAESSGKHTTSANTRHDSGGPDAYDGRNYVRYWNVRIFTGANFQFSVKLQAFLLPSEG